MQWGVLAIGIFFLILAYIVVQGTRAAMAWRKAADAGDVKVIRDIVEDAITTWRSMKRPKEAALEVWRGVQSMQLVDVGPGFVRVSCEAEGQYRLVDGRWTEMTNPLQEGVAITARVADMLLYELPHFKAANFQIDVYTSFRDADGTSRRRCILSTEASRDAARSVDWEDWTAADIVDAFGGRYELGERGQPQPIEVQEPPQPVTEEAAAATAPS